MMEPVISLPCFLARISWMNDFTICWTVSCGALLIVSIRFFDMSIMRSSLMRQSLPVFFFLQVPPAIQEISLSRSQVYFPFFPL